MFSPLQEKRLAAQEKRRLNDAPHILSRGGYALLEERIRRRRPSDAASDEDLAPLPRHQLWKAARTRSDGHMTSESARLIGERIVSHSFYILLHFQLCIVLHIIINDL